MKTFILLMLMTSSAFAFECKLTGSLKSEQEIVTSLSTSNLEDCKAIASETAKNNFFGLVEKGDELIETSLSFRKEEGSTEDKMVFEEEYY